MRLVERVLIGVVTLAILTGYNLSSLADSKTEEVLLKNYRLLEDAIRTGNGKLWLDLHSSTVLEQMDTTFKEGIEQGFPPRPDIRLQHSSLGVQKTDAAVFGKFINEDGHSQFHAVRFVLEQQDWKILHEEISEGFIDPHFFFPPEDGSFLRSGAPWSEVPYATKKVDPSIDDATKEWDMQAVLDESFLHIRLSSKNELPGVGSEVKEQGSTGAPALPLIVVEITSDQKQNGGPEQQYEIFVGDVTTIRWGEEPRYFVNYSMTFKHEDEIVAVYHATSFNHLLEVSGEFLNIKIPRVSLGLQERGSLQLVLSGPVSGFLPYEPAQF